MSDESTTADEPVAGEGLPDPASTAEAAAVARDETEDEVAAGPPPSAPPLRQQSSGRPVGKVRSPIGCWLLAIVTLGIYALVWYHHTNKELKEYDPAIVVSPGVAVVAVLVPVVNWFSVFNTGKRIRQAQQTAGIPASVSPGLGVVLTFVLGLWLPYYISQTNAVWESAGAV